MKKLLLLLTICLATWFNQAEAQSPFPFYDVELAPICQDSAGTRTTLYGINLYVFGRNQVLLRFYIDALGNKVVPGGGVTLYNEPCYELVEELEANALTFQSSFVGSSYTIAADTYNSITIVNIGQTNHNISIAGSSFRMVPGEHYFFYSAYDPVNRVYTTNPEIVIDPGTLGLTSLRIYLQTKN